MRAHRFAVREVSMSVEITAIRMSPGGSRHEHITDYRWVSREDSDTGDSSKATMVDWIDNKNGIAYVGSGTHQVRVGVVHPDNTDPYLRTYADKEWNNNLLALPRF
jgi:hypothetical protein